MFSAFVSSPPCSLPPTFPPAPFVVPCTPPQAAGHKTLVPQLVAELKAQGMDKVLVMVGGVIPPDDYDFLYKAGAGAIFGPGTRIPTCALDILKKISTDDA